MKTLHEIYKKHGLERRDNGGGLHNWDREVALGVTMNACNGQADEAKETDTRVHVGLECSTDSNKWWLGAFVKRSQLDEALGHLEKFGQCLSADQEI